MPTIEQIRVRTRHTVSAHIENAEAMTGRQYTRMVRFSPARIEATWDRDDGAGPWVLYRVTVTGALLRADGTLSKSQQAGWSGQVDDLGRLHDGPDWVREFVHDHTPAPIREVASEKDRAEVIEQAAKEALARNEKHELRIMLDGVEVGRGVLEGQAPYVFWHRVRITTGTLTVPTSAKARYDYVPDGRRSTLVDLAPAYKLVPVREGE